MAPKIRPLHADFFTDDAVCALPPLARLMFQGLWCLACDNGHVEDRSRQIKRRVLPDDDVNASELIDLIAGVDLITREDGWIIIAATHRWKIDWRYFKTCEYPGCAKPERETQRVPGGYTPSPRSAPDVDPMGTRRAPATDGDGDSDGEGDEQRVGSAIALTDATRIDVERICQHLADRVEANGAKRPTITKRWRDAARLMLDNDHRDEAEIHKAIDWSQADEFWRANILSLPKLRDKFDTLKMQAQRNGRPSRQAETDALFERAAKRMGVTQ